MYEWVCAVSVYSVHIIDAAAADRMAVYVRMR